MRIAFFSDAYHPRVSGQVVSMDEFCTTLTERGHEVCIVCPAYPPERMQGRKDLFYTIRVPSGSALVSEDDRLAIPWKTSEALRELDEFKPQAVHVQTEFSIGTLGRRYCRQRGIPILSTCHTFYEMYIHWYLPLLPSFTSRPLVKSWLRSVYSNDALIITPTNRIRDVMMGYGIDKEYAVIPTGVDERLFKPCKAEGQRYRQELEGRHPSLRSSTLLLYVGRISQEKNLELLADAMVIMLAREPNIHLLIVGDGPKRTEIHHAFHRRGLKDVVTWAGLMPREELPVIYSAADVFVFPSVTETQGLVTIEAMLCGAPVVGINQMGTGEIMAGDKGGFLADNNPEDFADKVCMLLADPELRAKKSREAMDHARRWTIGHACDEMEKIYNRIFG